MPRHILRNVPIVHVIGQFSYHGVRTHLLDGQYSTFSVTRKLTVALPYTSGGHLIQEYVITGNISKSLLLMYNTVTIRRPTSRATFATVNQFRLTTNKGSNARRVQVIHASLRQAYNPL